MTLRTAAIVFGTSVWRTARGSWRTAWERRPGDANHRGVEASRSSRVGCSRRPACRCRRSPNLLRARPAQFGLSTDALIASTSIGRTVRRSTIDVDAVLRQLIGRLHRDERHLAVRDDRAVVALALEVGTTESRSYSSDAFALGVVQHHLQKHTGCRRGWPP